MGLSLSNIVIGNYQLSYWTCLKILIIEMPDAEDQHAQSIRLHFHFDKALVIGRLIAVHERVWGIFQQP